MMPLFQKSKEYMAGIYTYLWRVIVCPYYHQTVLIFFSDFLFFAVSSSWREKIVSHTYVDVYQKIVSCVYIYIEIH